MLKLTCTADDMIPLAEACSSEGPTGDGVHRWKEIEHAQLRAELDAAFAYLYGVEHREFEDNLSTFPSFHDGDKAGVMQAFEDPAVGSLGSVR